MRIKEQNLKEQLVPTERFLLDAEIIILIVWEPFSKCKAMKIPELKILWHVTYIWPLADDPFSKKASTPHATTAKPLVKNHFLGIPR